MRIVLFFLLALLALPAAVGLLAAEGAPRVIEQALARQGATPEDTTLERGWFTSRAEQRFELDDGGLRRLLGLLTGEATITGLVVTTTIRHGPLPGGAPALARARTRYAALDTDGALHPLPVRSETRVALGGAGRTRVTLEPIAGACLDNTCLDLDGGEFLVGQTRDAADWDVEGALGPGTLTSLSGWIGVRKLGLRGTVRATAAGPEAGRADMAIENLEIASAAAGESTTLTTLALSSEIRVDGPRFTQILRVEAPSILTGGGEPGQFRLAAAARDLDAATIYRLGRDLAAVPPNGRPGQVGELLVDAWGDLAVHGPGLEISDLTLESGDGEGSGRLRLQLPPAEARRGRGLAGALYEDLDAELTLRLSEELLQSISAASPDTGQHLAALMSLGYLSYENGHYRLDATYGGRLLTINGRPLPLPSL